MTVASPTRESPTKFPAIQKKFLPNK